VAKIRRILAALAAVFLLLMLRAVGWQAIGRHLLLVGWGWPLVLAPYFLVNLLGAMSWFTTINPRPPRLRLWHLFFYRLAGEAVNTATPTASLGGEPFKALLIEKHGIPLTAASASVVITKGVYALSLSLYICLGLALAPFLLALPEYWLLGLVLAAVGLVTGCILFVRLQKRGLGRLGLSFLKKIGVFPGFLEKREEAIQRFDDRMIAFYQEKQRNFYLALGLSGLAWFCHGLEVYVIFYLLGRPLGLMSSWCFDGLAQLITGLAFMIPANLGVQDAGSLLLALGFHLGAVLGGTFVVIRRFREAFYVAIGLVVLAWKK
jgi:uncharacterized protein (TIRG00374 family)